MRISDWSSDVCSSDLIGPLDAIRRSIARLGRRGNSQASERKRQKRRRHDWMHGQTSFLIDALTHEPHAREGTGKVGRGGDVRRRRRSEEHTSEIQSLMRISYAVFCLKKKNKKNNTKI